MNHDSHTSLIQRHINSITRAEYQAASFLRAMKELDRDGIKLTDGNIAKWLLGNGVKLLRKRKVSWTAQDVATRFNVDELDFEGARVAGHKIAADYRQWITEGHPQANRFTVALIKWLKKLNGLLPERAATIDEAIDAAAAYTQARASTVARELRAQRAAYE